MNPFSDNFFLNGLFTILGDFFSTILDYLNPLSDNFIIKILLQGLYDLFIPSQEDFNQLWSDFSSHFGFYTTIKNYVIDIQDLLENSESSPSLVIHVNKTKFTDEFDAKVIDLSWYAPYKEFGDLIIAGFIYVAFIWRMFIHLPSIISGIGGGVQASQQVEDINRYQKSGFGRDSSPYRHQSINHRK